MKRIIRNSTASSVESWTQEENQEEGIGVAQILVIGGILSFAVALFLAMLGMRIPFLISATLGLILIFRAGWLTKWSMRVKNE